MQNINFAKKKQNIIKYKKLLSHTKMGKEIFMFGDIETEKNKFYHYKNPIFYQIQIQRKYVSNQISSGKKNFIGYLYDGYKIKPLHIMLSKTSAYLKNYDGKTKWMYFVIENDDLLEKYNTIWDKACANIKKILIAKLSIMKFFLKTKIKSHGDEVTGFQLFTFTFTYHTCLAVISLDSAINKDGNYFPQVF